jgi:YVTN family beta-propeller protein
MATDPAGKYLYLAGRNSNNVGAMVIDARTGALTSVTGAPFPGGSLPRSVAMDPSGRFVYLTNINDDNVSGYRVDAATGALTSLPGSPFPAGDAPQFIQVHPNGKFAYLTNWNSRNIWTYRVAGDGALRRERELQLDAAVFPFGLSFDHGGRHMYVSNWFGGVFGFNVSANDGALSPIAGSPFPAKGNVPTSLWMAPAGRFAYVTNYSSHDITPYTVDDASGALTVGETFWARPGPRALAFVAGDRPVEFEPQSVYVANSADNTLTAYRVNATGVPTATATAPTGADPRAVAVDPLGRFVYVANGSGTISVYRFDPAVGAPKEIAGSPFKSQPNPVALTVDANGRFVYVASAGGKNMSVHAIDARTGGLRELTSADLGYVELPRLAGTDPRSVVLHPTERFAYVLDSAADKIFVFSYYGQDPLVVDLNPQTTFVEVAKNPTALAADPRGKFLYVTHGSINALGIYALNVFTGEIQAVPGSPFAAGASPSAVAVHPNGQFVYVANKGSGDITIFRADTEQGRFNRIGQVKAGTAPVAISVEGSGRYAYVANEQSDSMTVYTIDAGGGLKESKTISTGGKPSALAVFTAIR